MPASRRRTSSPTSSYMWFLARPAPSSCGKSCPTASGWGRLYGPCGPWPWRSSSPCGSLAPTITAPSAGSISGLSGCSPRSSARSPSSWWPCASSSIGGRGHHGARAHLHHRPHRAHVPHPVRFGYYGHLLRGHSRRHVDGRGIAPGHLRLSGRGRARRSRGHLRHRLPFRPPRVHGSVERRGGRLRHRLQHHPLLLRAGRGRYLRRGARQFP